MRWFLAIALLIAFGSPLVAPLFAATVDPEASLPACCRSHGKHHCAMMHLMLAASGGPALQAPPCPYYPTAFTPPRLATAFLVVAPKVSAEIRRDRATLPAIGRLAVRTFIPSANLKRGPPAILA
jgi:hypothetical protein